MAVVYLILIAVVLGGVAGFAYYNNSPIFSEETVEKGKSIFNEVILKSSKGDEVVILVLDPPEKEETELIQAQNFTKAVELAEEKIQVCQKLDPNGCIIQGYSKLIHPVTLKPITPYFYKFNIVIDCAEIAKGYDYCNTEQILFTGITTDAGKDEDGNDLGGKWNHKWRPTLNTYAGSTNRDGELTQKGMYDISIFVMSKTLEDTKRYEEWSGTFQIEMRE